LLAGQGPVLFDLVVPVSIYRPIVSYLVASDAILMQFMDDVSSKDSEKLNLSEISDLKLNS
jgi:amino acid permease